MDNILVRNFRGLNRCSEQHSVKKFKMRVLYQQICPRWCFTSNSCVVDQGRIIVAWLPSAFHVSVELVTE